MRAVEATALRLLVSSLGAAAVGCQRPPSPGTRPSDAGTMVTVYVAPQLADRLMGRLQRVAARHQWALSVRTDGSARADADLVIVDSAGTPVARLRRESPAAAQAKQMADAVLP